MPEIASEKLLLENPKAFLCHSTVDKDYINTVAKRLGRRRVNVDNLVFVAGSQLLKAIRDSLARSDLFVLFANQHSLQSLWVKFEVAEAEELLRSESLKSSLILLIDQTTKPADLPRWMQRALVERVPGPNAAARIIEYHLNKLRGRLAEPLFIGREALLKELAEKLIPVSGATPPHIVIVGGLPGIGRRTFLTHAMSNALSLRTGPTLTLRPTDGIDALHLLLLDEVGALDTKSQMTLAIEQFQKADLKEKAKKLAMLLASSSQGNVAPVIVDEGALLDSSGAYTEDANALLQALSEFPQVTVAIVHTKRPTIDDVQVHAFDAIYVSCASPRSRVGKAVTYAEFSTYWSRSK